MILDIFVGAILLISAVISFIRGLIREILTIFGVVGGLLSAYFFGDNVSNLVEGWLRPEESNFEIAGETEEKLLGFIPYDFASDIIAYGAVFIIVVGILSVVSHFSAESLKKIGLGALDRTLGVIFGLLRGVLFLGLLYLPFHMLFDKETKDSWSFFENSRTYFYLEKTSEIIASFLPGTEGTDQEEPVEQEETDEFGTRKILQDLKVLKEESDAGFAPFGAGAPADGDLNFDPEAEKTNAKPGYDDDFRNTMDKLFEEGDKVIDKLKEIEAQELKQGDTNQ